jgi:hypothetical protein
MLIYVDHIGTRDLRGVVLHELGHALGLDHGILMSGALFADDRPMRRQGDRRRRCHPLQAADRQPELVRSGQSLTDSASPTRWISAADGLRPRCR